jgi:small subunit ribosomal protein S2
VRLYCEAVATAATRGGREAVVASGADIGAMDEPLPEIVVEEAPVEVSPITTMTEAVEAKAEETSEA